MAAKTPPKAPAKVPEKPPADQPAEQPPAQDPNAPKPDYAPDDDSIEARMWRMNEDQKRTQQ